MNKTTNYKMDLPSNSDIIEVSVLDGNFTKIDSVLKEHEDKIAPVTLPNKMEVLSAGGHTSFYHGTTAGVNNLLSSVRTSFGNAQFRELYGTINASNGSTNELYVVIEAVNGVIYWDEYCNASDVPGNAVYIGTEDVTWSGADTVTDFSYNNGGSGSTDFSVRDAIVELAIQIQALRGA